MLVALGCQKEKAHDPEPVTSSATKLSTKSKELLNDSNFVKLYKISLPLFNALKGGRSDLIELKDGVVYYKESASLAPKLGFKDSASLVNYFLQVNMLAPKVAKAHPNMTLKQCQDAVIELNKTSLTDDPDPCQDAVTGQFAMNVTQCAALGLIPIVGEVLAGTCMVGALITYTAGLEACAEAEGNT